MFKVAVCSWCFVLALPVLDSLLDPGQESLDPGVDPGGRVCTALAVADHAKQGVPSGVRTSMGGHMDFFKITLTHCMDKEKEI